MAVLMQPDIVSRSIWASFERLPPDERSLVEFICVYRRFDAQIIDYIAQALRIDIDHDQVTALPMVERYEGGQGADGFRLRPLLRQRLLERLRGDDDTTYKRAHRLAAGYFHQDLDPLNVSGIAWYVEEVHHLAFAHTERAFSRLATFSHTALMAGYPEAASRAAAAALEGTPASEDEGPAAEMASLAGVIQSVSAILASPTRVDERAIMHLDSILIGSRPSADLAASRIAQLARDLVTYYSERLAPTPRMSSALAPSAALTVAVRRGQPEVSAGLAMAEAVAHFPHTVMKRVHAVELQGMAKVRHSVKTTLYTQTTGTQPTEALVDIFPWEAGDTLDNLEVRDANGWAVHSLKSVQAQSRIASAVASWLTDSAGDETSGEEMSVTLRREISQSLVSAMQDREHETVGHLLQAAAEQSDGNLQTRIRSAIRYLPLVAELDANPRTSQRLQYHYWGPCTVRREGMAGIGATLELVLPTVVRNHLEIPTPDGLELAGMHFDSEIPATVEARPHRRHWPQNGTLEMPEEFTVAFDRDDDRPSNPANRVVRAELSLRYAVQGEDVARVRRVNLVCVLACLAAVFLPYVLNGAVWSNMFSWVATAFVVVDAYFRNPRTDPGVERQELRAYANRPIKLVLAANVIAAVVAAAMANVEDAITALTVSVTSLGICCMSALLLYSVALQRRRYLRQFELHMTAAAD
ncbi:hypothetical protein [Streptomyces sp. NBC_00467]|uniref:hypothetical protein n=1 Tax=Streptomyces sp. NBC_00467 TaxID=2975752 RepID=UPI002E198E6C